MLFKGMVTGHFCLFQQQFTIKFFILLFFRTFSIFAFPSLPILVAMGSVPKANLNRKIVVSGSEISIVVINEEDYISLTDMIRSKEGEFFIIDWLRNRNTLEFLGIWESIHNPDFNYGEFATIKSMSGLNSFKVSVKEWAERTNAKGIYARAGRYGGTYAHKDIAFKFGAWISAEFEVYLIKDYQRLKAWEQSDGKKEWDFRRFLSKVNYRIQTDAIEECLIPISKLPKDKQGIEYALEADILNIALFGCTAKQWQEKNPAAALRGENIRDHANLIHLTVLANLEPINAVLIKGGLSKMERLEKLREYSQQQLQSLIKDRKLRALSEDERMQRGANYIVQHRSLQDRSEGTT